MRQPISFYTANRTPATLLLHARHYVWVLALLCLPGFAQAQSTAFTYHGRLNENGGAVNGNYEFSFSVYDVAVNGVPVAGPLPTSSAVTNGLFTVAVDFGPGIFTGPPRFLAIGVRPVGGGAFQLLTPRLELTSSPYAIHAASAGTAAGVANGAVVKSLNNLHDNLTLAAGANMTITPNGNTLTLAAAGAGGSGIWSVNGNNAYYNAGNVGLGTTTPAHRLSLSGGPSWTANGWLGAIELPNIAAIGWQANLAGQRFGMGHTDTGFYLFRTASNPGTTGSPALYDFSINDAGNVSINGSVGVGRDISFGTQLRQMLNLYGNSFGVGVQNNAFYQRSGGEFVWYYGGAHSDAFLNGGGGQLLLRLNTTGLVTDRSFFFQSGTKQMLNLYNTSYGIGVQPSTMYFRTDNNSAGEGFAWYKGGTHTDNTADPGPNGVKLMTLTSAGLNVTGAASVCSLTIRGGCDLAEPFQMANGEISKGAVVVIDEEHPGKLKLSGKAYDKSVAGIVSGANGVNPGISLQQEGVLEGGQNVSLSGRVYVQADASNGSIKPGDLLTTSSTPGHAMKVMDHAQAQGAILGKAMSGLKDGKGMVLVLVTLQ